MTAPPIPGPRQAAGLGAGCARRAIRVSAAWGLFALALLSLLLARAAAGPPDVQAFRMTVSSNIMSDVNGNDLRASMKVWSNAFEQQVGIRIDTERGILASPEQLFDIVRKGLTDGFSCTTPEFMRLSAFVDPGNLLVDEAFAEGGEEYIILAHAQSGIQSVSDLRGRSLAFHKNAKTCLASAWLATLLHGTGASSPEEFFGSVTANTQMSRGVVLPVFFRQVDACLVTRRGFSTMCELNPQLAQKLRVVANSPRVIPEVMGFHKDCPPERRQKYVQALLAMHQSVVGQQLLTLFESRRILVRDISCLRGSIEMVNAAEQIRAKAVSAKR